MLIFVVFTAVTVDDAVQFGTNVPTFWRKLRPQSPEQSWESD